MTKEAYWTPDDQTINSSNINQMMLKNGLRSYEDLWSWSVENKKDFWSQTVDNLGIKLQKPYQSIVDLANGIENPQWLKGAKYNIVDSCFQNDDKSTAVIFQKENGSIEKITQKQLKQYVNKIANGLRELGIEKGDYIAIDMPMTLEAVAVYLAGIKAGNPCSYHC